MAPLPPPKTSARALRTQRVTGQIHPLLPSKIFRTDAHVTDDFLSTKRDKRLIKHSSFVSRITSSKITKTKRRRPKNKLKTSLDGLADALPELTSGEGGEEALAGKIKHKSLRSKKGALKRKERLVKGEMDRFGVSMAKLNGMDVAMNTLNRTSTRGNKTRNEDSDNEDDEMTTRTSEQQPGSQGSSGAAPGATSNRWAALRGYISSTMEQNPAFAGK
ncbi:hypothetical protein QQS21_001198 [Conoideocrella luteorostrata]|uniref:Ribosome biogenesis protein SLX9 n=1 Tax=Conoideocrella luteorostrata TaxID=1105319 RepID=A0AAJ0FXQ7_9HYPO|nr:hypothetical protein QQS21_001198 [Conoideocrella luteorostrata]